MAGFFHIPQMTSLALHGMALIAAAEGRPVNVKEMAAATGASAAHLAKVMQRLVRAGLVHSTRGPGGGFTLAQPAAGITLLAIYQAIEGEGAPHGCPLHRPVCPFTGCIFGGILTRLEEDLAAFLAGRSLAEISGTRREAEGNGEGTTTIK